MVGAVVVRDGRIVGEGYHRRAGEPHAEVVALQRAGRDSRGATLYVTLEPCCHSAQTPPCTNAIIDAGVMMVVAAMADPDRRVSGKGFKRLEEAGIEVRRGVCEEAARELNEAYVKHRTTGLPLVILKSAMSLDGKIATRTGESKWITGDRARAYAHRLRSRVDAILIGGRTARVDDPRLTARAGSHVRYPMRVILSRKAEIPEDLNVFREPGETVVACSEDADSERLRKLAEAGARILTLKEVSGRLPVRELMKRLGEMGVLSVLIEGGGETAAAALEEKVVDRIVYFYAPIVIGGKDAVSAVAGLGAADIGSAIRLSNVKTRRLGNDFVIEGRVLYA